jgi:hypothetical protein
MSQPYSKMLPVDKMGNALQDFPPATPALQRDYSENNGTSSLITLNANTTNLEVGCQGASGAVIRWITSTDTAGSVIGIPGATANFDHFIPINSVRKFVVPVVTRGMSSSVVGANAQAGLYPKVAVISVGIASVITTQY